jgi:hypothetical protein
LETYRSLTSSSIRLPWNLPCHGGAGRRSRRFRWSSSSRAPGIQFSLGPTLDLSPRPVEDGFKQMMTLTRILLLSASLAGSLALVRPVVAQNPPSSSPEPKSGQPKPDPQARITVEVTGGDQETPVENASVYFKYIEEHKVKKNKTMELNVKTNREGVAHVPDAPLGRVLVQVLAEGWKTYGRWFDITDPKQTIKVHLERPPKWY